MDPLTITVQDGLALVATPTAWPDELAFRAIGSRLGGHQRVFERQWQFDARDLMALCSALRSWTGAEPIVVHAPVRSLPVGEARDGSYDDVGRDEPGSEHGTPYRGVSNERY